MTRQQLLDGYVLMRQDISDEAEKALVKISKYINKYIMRYGKKQFIDGLYDLVLELMIEVYSITSETIRKLYPDIDVERLTDEEIMGLTYTADGKELRERIEDHYDDSKEHKGLEKEYMLHRMVLIIDTEKFGVSNKILHKKLAKYAAFAEVVGVAECWDETDSPCEFWINKGKMPIKELTDIPPYHPDCDCEVIYYLE